MVRIFLGLHHIIFFQKRGLSPRKYLVWPGLCDLTPCALARLRAAASDKPRVIRIKKAFFIRQRFAFHPAKAGKAKMRGEMQIILLIETFICRVFHHCFNKISTGRCGRAPQTKQCGILRRRRRVNKGLPIKCNRYLTTRFCLSSLFTTQNTEWSDGFVAGFNTCFGCGARPHLQRFFWFICMINSATN